MLTSFGYALAAKYAKMLEEVGFSREQSEATIHILAEVMEDKLATKQDIAKLRREVATLRSELIIQMGAIQAAPIAILVGLLKFL